MKLPFSRSGSTENSAPRDSRWQETAAAGPESKPRGESRSHEPGAEARAEAEARHELRKQLLELVLARTLQKAGIPPQWFGAELNPMVLPSGEEWIEVRLSVQVDEPRLLYYLASIQADFERRLLDADPQARRWLAGVAWKLTPDPVYEEELPHAEYWELVQEDRLLTARQKGAMEWDAETLNRHFSDTNPAQADFVNTKPPQRDVEDIAPSRNAPL